MQKPDVSLGSLSGASTMLFALLCYTVGLPGGANGKEPTYQCRKHQRCEFDPWVGKIPWSKNWQPTPVFLPEESHGQVSQAGYSPWGHKESDMTEHTCQKIYMCYPVVNWQPTPVFLPRESCGQRSLAAAVHRVTPESDMTEAT